VTGKEKGQVSGRRVKTREERGKESEGFFCLFCAVFVVVFAIFSHLYLIFAIHKEKLSSSPTSLYIRTWSSFSSVNVMALSFRSCCIRYSCVRKFRARFSWCLMGSWHHQPNKQQQQ